MNENIGVKGGKQDRKRSFMIKKRTLEKLKCFVIFLNFV